MVVFRLSRFSSHTGIPLYMVSLHLPDTSQPVKGVLLPMEQNSAGSMVYVSFRSYTVRLAGMPTARGVPMPKRLDGFVCIKSMSIFKVRTPFFTRLVYKIGKAVSSPT